VQVEIAPTPEIERQKKTMIVRRALLDLNDADRTELFREFATVKMQQTDARLEQATHQLFDCQQQLDVRLAVLKQQYQNELQMRTSALENEIRALRDRISVLEMVNIDLTVLL
jgi:hypothetical protein